jgi:hypothetical protein
MSLIWMNGVYFYLFYQAEVLPVFYIESGGFLVVGSSQGLWMERVRIWEFDMTGEDTRLGVRILGFKTVFFSKRW